MSWWEKKLGGGPQPPPAPPPRPSPYQHLLPQGMGQDQDRVVQNYLARQQGPWAPQQPAQPQQGEVPQVGPNELAVPAPQGYMPIDGDPNEYHRRMWGWTGNPRGGARETQTTGNCPSCGSPRFFSRSNAMVTNTNTGMACPPKPQCFECGYPNEQGTLSASTVVPGVKGSRQLGPGELIVPADSRATLHSAGFRPNR